MLTKRSGHFIDFLLERPDVIPVWERFVNHPFVLGLGNGELPLESFKGYLIQDYLFLVHFARANALASYKAKTMEDIAAVGHHSLRSRTLILTSVLERQNGVSHLHRDETTS